jgi:peptidoglycan/LPS O-acetylase OafA/YrhL
MLERLRAAPQTNETGLLYISSLDGLRLLAFLAVFIHHLPVSMAFLGMEAFQRRGWVGVELFFVISAFLFFHLFEAEVRKAGFIDVKRFYLRRFLRIYPLMVAFPAAMIIWTGAYTKDAIFRLVGLMAGADNLVTAFDGYSPIPFSPQLWTLSFEFQIYLVIPFAFLAYQKYGTRRFLIGAAIVWGLCTLLRIAAVLSGVGYLPAWVLPFLRPDSVLLGMLLSIFVKDIPPLYALAAGLGAASGFFALPLMEQSATSQILVFPAAAIMCGALVALAHSWRPLGRVLSLRWATFAGTISFGLYVFHVFGIYLAGNLLERFGVDPSTASAAACVALTAVAFAATFAMAAASYMGFERPFLKLKDRFAAVHGRPAV